MRILLTGATGRIGAVVVDHLVAAGHELTIIGRRDGVAFDNARYVQCDIEDFERLLHLADGQDAIVHMAAISDPARAPAVDTFRINASGTFTIFQAAVEAGVPRVVQASSINAIGFGQTVYPVDPVYFPIDERHPTRPRDPYSLSKTVIEDVGRYFYDRFEITNFALRIPGMFVATRERLAQRAVMDIDVIEEGFRQLEAMPVPERLRFMAEHHRISREARLESWRRRQAGLPPAHDSRNADPRWIALAQRGGFYCMCDARDHARAVERCLETCVRGSHVLFINDDRNAPGIETERLLAICFPNVRNRKSVYEGDESLVSVERAKHLVGFVPQYHLADMS